MKKYTISEIFNEKNLYTEIKTGNLNLIVADCGAGKTYWISKYIATQFKNNKNILYITDSKLNVKSFSKKFKDTYYPKNEENYNEQQIIDSWTERGNYVIDNELYKLYIQNFNHIATYLRYNPNFINQFDIIVFDELHGIFWRNNCKNLINLIPELVNNKIVIGISATPRLIFGHYRDELKNRINDILKPYQSEIKSHPTHNIIEVNNFNAFDFNQLKGKTFLFYTPLVKNQIKYKQLMVEAGLKVEFICSDSHKQFTPNMKVIKDYIIEENTIPHELDGLIINDSACTGLDFNGIDCVLVDSKLPDDHKQVRGRVREPLNELYQLPVNDYDKFLDNIYLIESILNDYADKPLFKKEQQELLNELFKLGFHKRNKPLTTIKAFQKQYDELMEKVNENYAELVHELDFEIESKRWKKHDEHRDESYVLITIKTGAKNDKPLINKELSKSAPKYEDVDEGEYLPDELQDYYDSIYGI